MKDKLLKLIKEEEERKAELKKGIESATDIKELRSLYDESTLIDKKIAEYRSMIDEIEKEEKVAEERKKALGNNGGVPPLEEGNPTDQQKRNAGPQGDLNPLGTYSQGTEEANKRNELKELETKYEQRGQDLKDKKKVTYDMRSELPIARAITVVSSNLVVPSQYSNTLNPTFNQVSSIVDLVHAVPMMGGETYTKGFKVPVTDLADYTPENTAYKNVDSVWDKVTISKTSITDYTEISKQSIKLPNIDYQSQVGTDLRNALRRKIGREIMIGDGTAGHFVGIFNAPANVIPVESDLAISEIDADTLDTIVFGYGGDEDVEGTAYLILNKKDLAAFAAIRTADGKKLYKIVTNGNTGTISSDGSFSVNYVINSICPAISDDKTQKDTYCMAYGILANYEMPVFSNIDVEMSTDYKFGEGMVAYSGDVYSGGNVAAYKGFERIKKA